MHALTKISFGKMDFEVELIYNKTIFTYKIHMPLIEQTFIFWK